MSYTKSIIDDVVDITCWETHDDTDDLSGNSEKETVTEPITGLSCMFKRPSKARKHQIWSEMLASAIAGGLRWKVQRAGVAVRKDPSNGKIIDVGNILPHFYNSIADNGNETLVDGEKYCHFADYGYYEYDDEFGQRGCGNTLPLLREGVSTQLYRRHRLKSNHFLLFLSRIFAFDALITCTDRHPKNWGIITDNRSSNVIRMAPIFDNASSLGCAFRNLNEAYGADGKIRASHKRELQKWRSHVRLEEPAERGSSFIDVSKAFLKTFPKGVISFRNASLIDIDEVYNLMTRIRERFELPAPYALTKKRQEHIRFMLEIGKERIDEILKDFR